MWGVKVCSGEEEKIKPYGKPEEKKRIRSVKTPLKLFEKKIGMKLKGTYIQSIEIIFQLFKAKVDRCFLARDK